MFCEPPTAAGWAAAAELGPAESLPEDIIAPPVLAEGRSDELLAEKHAEMKRPDQRSKNPVSERLASREEFADERPLIRRSAQRKRGSDGVELTPFNTSLSVETAVRTANLARRSNQNSCAE